MMLPLSSRLDESIPSANGLYHRLILVVGPARSGKTVALTELADAKGWPRVNVNLQLAERLLDLTQKQRVVRVERTTSGIRQGPHGIYPANQPGALSVEIHPHLGLIPPPNLLSNGRRVIVAALCTT